VSTIRLSHHIVQNVIVKGSMPTSLNMKLLKSCKRQMSSGPNFRIDMQPLSRMPRALTRKSKCLFATSRHRLSESHLLKECSIRPLFNLSPQIIKLLQKHSKS
jgi:hypothetical protein